MLVWSNLTPHEVLQFPLQLFRGLLRIVQHDEGLRHHPMKLVRRTDHSGFGNSWMFQQHSFDFRRRNIDTAANDHVVVPALILKEAVTVTYINVARNVPTRAHISPLVLHEPQITAACRSPDREQAWMAIGYSLHGPFIYHHRLIARNDFPRQARA